MNKKLSLSLAIVFFILVFDQISKFWVKTSFFLGEEINVFGNWFILHFTENNGMAFGMEIAGDYGKIILSLFRIIAIIAIIFYLNSLIKKRVPNGLIICISLILAGAIGNIIDSAFYGLVFSDSLFQLATFMPKDGGYGTFLHGRVVDMLYFPIIQGQYPSWFPFWGSEDFLFFRPVFNIADSSITTGVSILLIFQNKFFPKQEEENDTKTEES